jgi:hypothetical protein
MVKAEKEGLSHSSGLAVERGRVSNQPIFSHPQGIGMSDRFR